MTSGELARRTGVTLRTVRYYEEMGLIRAAADVAGKRKTYDTTAVLAMRRIAILKEAGMSLEQIASLLQQIDAKQTEGKSKQHALEDLVEQARAGVQRKIAELRDVEGALDHALAKRDTCSPCRMPDCRGCAVLGTWYRFGLDEQGDRS